MAITKQAFKNEVKDEFFSILDYWVKYSADEKNGGFYGSIGPDNKGRESPKGVVATGRILWGFSTAIHFINSTPALHQYKHLTSDYEKLCQRAFDSLKNDFWDKDQAGVYWMVDAQGKKLEGKKILYGHSFYIYGMSEYYRATGYKPALEMAQKCFDILVEKFYDADKGGYIEGYAEDWAETDNYVLARGISRKSMNAHLHVLECFANLYRVDKSEKVHFHLKHCLEVVLNHIIGENKSRMTLFFSEDWVPQTKAISYGHDIEASWLVLESAEILDDEHLLERCHKTCFAMARDAAEGLQPDNGMIYEFDPENGHSNSSRDWWVMAEAMIGFYNAYQMSNKVHYLEKSENCWEFIKEYIIDYENGEWFGGVTPDHKVTGRAKGSPWKAPYHNVRACMELYNRLG